MSDERNVEARLLSILSSNLASSLIDRGVDSWRGSSVSQTRTPEYILAAFLNTAEFSPCAELRHVARLGLGISNEGDARFDPKLAREVCASVHRAISSPFPVARLRSLARLLEEIEEVARDFPYTPDQVEEYCQRLSSMTDGAEDENASSTSFRVRGVDSSARRCTYPPDTSPISSYPSSSESTDPLRARLDDAPQLYLFSIFVYHIGLLRLPTTYASLAVDSLRPGGGDLESWDAFTELLLKQWKTLGLFSTLIFGATLTMFQIPSVTSSSVLHILTHAALLCVLMSLVLTSLLSVYFGGWKYHGTAERWVQEVRTATPRTFWNFWVLISLPAVWTCWGIIFFLASMVLFMWPLGQNDLSQDPLEESIGARLFLMGLVLAGVVHLALVISTLRRGGSAAQSSIVV
ncbi:hypothetical protein DFH07DRAFT_802061 [Mycena maculata]|uniref:Uncharacterized protein n=1 Tax=Mycena maculata TaxID=230809 RepID=A0AAD7JY65_9AGAR|nr:hypothetical protein DFH07DRAFT_802061 [Mycena maculata]